jgi:hypothetical protein
MAYVQQRQSDLARMATMEAKILLLEELVDVLRKDKSVSDLEEQADRSEEMIFSLKCKIDRLAEWIPFFHLLWTWWGSR